MKKRSHHLLFLGVSVVLSASVVLLFLWTAGILLSSVIIFSARSLLILFLKISPLWQRQLPPTGSLRHAEQSRIGAAPGKIMPRIGDDVEKIFA